MGNCRWKLSLTCLILSMLFVLIHGIHEFCGGSMDQYRTEKNRKHRADHHEAEIYFITTFFSN